MRRRRIADKTPSELPHEAAVSSPSPTKGGSLDFGLASDQDAEVESDAEEPSTVAIQARQGPRPRQTPDHYASIRVYGPCLGCPITRPS